MKKSNMYVLLLSLLSVCSLNSCTAGAKEKAENATEKTTVRDKSDGIVKDELKEADNHQDEVDGVVSSSNSSENEKNREEVSTVQSPALKFLKDFYKAYTEDIEMEDRKLKKYFTSKGYSRVKIGIQAADAQILIQAQDDVPYEDIKITDIGNGWFLVTFDYSPDNKIKIEVINKDGEYKINDIIEIKQ